MISEYPDFYERLETARLVPVVVVNDEAEAIPLAEALIAGGLQIFEITLRTAAALPAIRAIADTFPKVLVGAGSVLNPGQFSAAMSAGASFIVSPGLSDGVIGACQRCSIPVLPGVATASEVMRGLDHGLSVFKFFPAEACGGVSALRSLGGPFSNVRFCPTGGVSPRNLETYLSQRNVISVGGSWMIPRDLSAPNAFRQVTEISKEALSIAHAHKHGTK